ncbi:MAG: Crp/Fnr family transcriptional regulator [Novosphingobium sp.]|nr:Crp/Fnr family transcriptional regulator [Novosphingobium sp.]
MAQGDLARLNEDHWLSGLPIARRDAIIRRLTFNSLPAGSSLYRMGDPPNGLFAVLDGRVRLVDYSAAGVELVAVIARPVFWIGEVSVLDGLERPHDAIAATSVRIAHLSMGAILDLASSEPLIWRDIALLSCIHQRMALRNTARIQTLPAIVRLAKFLVSISGGSPGTSVDLTQENLAQVIGVSRQRINVLLRQLKDRGLIRIAYRGIDLLDPNGLRNIAAEFEVP